MIILVYALIGPPAVRLRLTGVASERLELMMVDRIGVVVGELRRVPAPSVRNLRRYAEVIESLAARTSAILPARYGTTVADADELLLVIRARRLLRQRLKAVRGRAQMTIRLLESASGDAPSPNQRTVSTPARLRPGYATTEGTRYLRRKVADAAAARNVPAFNPVRPAIRRYVKEERVEKRSGIVTINHLVSRAAVDKYRSAVERAADGNDVRLIVTGPWPPYAFADTW